MTGAVTNALRSVRDAVKRAELPLYFLTAALAAYLAAANILRAAKWPDEETWAPGRVWFWAIVAAAVYVPIYALYKALDAHFERLDKQAAETSEAELQLLRDLKLLCQQAVAAIADACKGVEVNDLAIQVWLTRPDGSFRRTVRFYLPEERKSSGIEWHRGHGVAGTAWAADEDLYADLRPLKAKLRRLGPRKFNRLPPEERFGMRAKEVRGSRYTGICAVRLFSLAEGEPLRGIFIVDYVGTTDFACVADSLSERPVTTYIAGCERLLTDGPDIIDRQ
jgi:hypothetical protein